VSGGPGLSAEERRTLLAAAREAIAAHLAGREAVLPRVTGALAEPRGAFVTLHRRSDGELRGCVGVLRPEEPLASAVSRMAVAAATQDDRFGPVEAAELAELRVGDKRGVLLPRVPVDHGWDRDVFLAQTCRKAGLAADAWTQAGTQLQGFTATVFSDAD
jgi:AMMECR1 domain-containing protein